MIHTQQCRWVWKTLRRQKEDKSEQQLYDTLSDLTYVKFENRQNESLVTEDRMKMTSLGVVSDWKGAQRDLLRWGNVLDLDLGGGLHRYTQMWKLISSTLQTCLFCYMHIVPQFSKSPSKWVENLSKCKMGSRVRLVKTVSVISFLQISQNLILFSVWKPRLCKKILRVFYKGPKGTLSVFS